MSSKVFKCLFLACIILTSIICLSYWRRFQFYDNSTDVDYFEKVTSNVKTVVLFIGYPRSGHTLVASLMDAHPHVIVSNEYDLIYKWTHSGAQEKDKMNIFYKLYNSSYWEAKVGYRAPGDGKGYFKYHVPHQWQGKFKEYIQVIGDKKGGRTTRQLGKDGKQSVIEEMQQTLKIPIKLIHVVRNPFDTISTMVLRLLNKRKQVHTLKKKISDEKLLRERIGIYFKLAATNDELRGDLGGKIFDLHSEKLIGSPRKILRQLCEFLEVECSDSYIKDCSSIIYKEESHTREYVEWPQSLIDEVQENIKQYDFLKGYSYLS